MNDTIACTHATHLGPLFQPREYLATVFVRHCSGLRTPSDAGNRSRASYLCSASDQVVCRLRTICCLRTIMVDCDSTTRGPPKVRCIGNSTTPVGAVRYAVANQAPVPNYRTPSGEDVRSPGRSTVHCITMVICSMWPTRLVFHPRYSRRH